MDDTCEAQHAVQIALQTLKERCQQFQDRISMLEEQNLELQNKLVFQQNVTDHSLTEIDKLKLEITTLTEQKNQWENEFNMVSLENRRLWTRLSNAIQKNENWGLKLNKISDSIIKHRNISQTNNPAALIRSKTFTQDEPILKVENITEENRKVSLELQDVSLKLLSTISQEKLALEKQCSQLLEKRNLSSNFINNFAFSQSYDPAGEPGLIEEFAQQLTILTKIKDELLKQKETLQSHHTKLGSVKGKNIRPIERTKKVETQSISVQTEHAEIEDEIALNELSNWGTPEVSANFLPTSEESTTANSPEKICPMCSNTFPQNTEFEVFQSHVESHFLLLSLN